MRSEPNPFRRIGATRISKPAGAVRNFALLLAVGFSIFSSAPLNAQQVTGMQASSFRVQLETYPPPNETQIKTSLEGSKAEPQSGGKVLLFEPNLKYFTTNGAVEVNARSSNCVFDTMSRTVSSTNILKVEMANGKFYTEGRGFFLQKTNSSILLSNEVHTIIRPARKASKS